MIMTTMMQQRTVWDRDVFEVLLWWQCWTYEYNEDNNNVNKNENNDENNNDTNEDN